MISRRPRMAADGGGGAGIGCGSSSSYSVSTTCGPIKITDSIVRAASGTQYYSKMPEAIGKGAGLYPATVDEIAMNNAIVIEDETGTVYGTVTLTEPFALPDGCTLTISPGATLEGMDYLDLRGQTLQNGNLTEKMIIFPSGLYYTGTDQSEAIKTGITYGSDVIDGQEYEADPSAWTVEVAPSPSGQYQTYTVHIDNTQTNAAITQTVTLLQSGAQFTGDGKAKRYLCLVNNPVKR